MRFPRADDNAEGAKREPIDLDALRCVAQGAVLAALAREDDAFDILAAVAPADVARPPGTERSHTTASASATCPK